MSSSELLDALRSAHDLRSLNAARLALQRFGTPGEVLAAGAIAPGFSDDFSSWFMRLQEHCFWEKPLPEAFARSTDDPEWTLFRGPSGPAGRELIVGFAGSSGMVNHSSPILLQKLDADRHDLLIIRDLSIRFFADGAAGAGSFQELLDRIRKVAAPYASIVTLGASMGGGAALEAGLALGARRAVSLAGGPRAGVTGVSDDPGSTTELWCFYGQENERDTERAAALQQEYPRARRFALPGVRDHNVSHAAFCTGRSTPLFAFMLGSDEATERTTGAERPSEPTVLHLTPSCVPPTWALRSQDPRPNRSMLGRLSRPLRRSLHALAGTSRLSRQQR
jgi:hypothetical protein